MAKSPTRSQGKGAGKKGAGEDRRVLASNRRARHDYFIDETVEAGLVLTGSEIKSARAGQVSLQEAYIDIDGREAWLVGARIAPYSHGGYDNHEPTRRRKLLLHRRQIAELYEQVRIKGVTVVPLQMYLRGGWAKLELGVARGKKQHDKRHAIREREQRREMDRATARRGRR